MVGAGYIGLELGTAFAKLGAKVTVIEALDRILPAYDAELVRPVARRLPRWAWKLTQTKTAGLSDAGDALLVDQGGPVVAPSRWIACWSPPAGGQAFRLRPRTVDLTVDRGAVQIDERCATSMRNVGRSAI